MLASVTSCGPTCGNAGLGGCRGLNDLHHDDPNAETQWAEMNQIMYSWAKIMVAIND